MDDAAQTPTTTSTPRPIDEGQARAVLERTWHAFFARFGRLTRIQQVAIAPILAGRSVLVTAPTATGKTEAMLAPLCERLLDRHGPGKRDAALELIVISPTRALCNDLHRRLQRPLKTCKLSLDLKTGDSPSFNDDKPPSVLITTPESLDSMLARRPASLRNVRAVVLDELHLVARAARGDQLQCLLERLEHVSAAKPVQRVAASATVPDAGSLAEAFLGQDTVMASDPEARSRPIIAETAPAETLEEAIHDIVALYEGDDEDNDGDAPDQAGRRRRRKVLVFANSRAQVEELSAHLAARPDLRGRVFAHHGSLGRGERLRVEDAFLKARAAICVATMTLELGIDIGDVDRVCLVAPPPDVASLLQRVGRSNRKQDVTRVMCLHDGDFERTRFEHLLECARAGKLFTEQLAIRPTVIAQQALSLLFQNPRGWISPGALFSRLPPTATALYSKQDVEGVMGAMVERGYIRRVDHGRYVADELGHKGFETGRIHSLIADSSEIEVVDELTGRLVGHVRFGSREREKLAAGVGVSLALGGRAHDVTRMRERKLYVQSGEGVEKSHFIAREAPRYSYGLARSFAGFLGIERDTMPVRHDPVSQTWYLSHFQGTVRAILLRWVLTARRYQLSAPSGPFFQGLKNPPMGDGGLGTADEIRRLVTNHLTRHMNQLVRVLQPGPFVECIPDGVMERWVRASVDLDAFARDLAQLRFVEP